MPQDSGFENSNTEYDKVNHIDNNTWEQKRPYDEQPYLLLPANNFFIRLGNTQPSLKIFVKKLGERFGDVIALPSLSSYTIKIRVFDMSDNIVFVGSMSVVSETSGEIKYDFNALDFTNKGMYYFLIDFTADGSTFTLPSTATKFNIIVI